MFRYRPWFTKPDELHRKRGAIAGFVAGAAAQLVLMGLVHVAFQGGLSDQLVLEPSVYTLY
ncbi:MAG: hypothetical protein P8O10_06760 [Pseudorhodobacter sp.]|jgi:hypothetical protein|nr:hypothetical protein [Pseudorhodobacter sp.]